MVAWVSMLPFENLTSMVEFWNAEPRMLVMLTFLASVSPLLLTYIVHVAMLPFSFKTWVAGVIVACKTG